MALDRQPLEALRKLLATNLTGATMEDLAAYLRQIDSIEIIARGKAVAAMRETGASWREIARATGYGHTTVRFWFTRYEKHLQKLAEQQENPPQAD